MASSTPAGLHPSMALLARVSVPLDDRKVAGGINDDVAGSKWLGVPSSPPWSSVSVLLPTRVAPRGGLKDGEVSKSFIVALSLPSTP